MNHLENLEQTIRTMSENGHSSSSSSESGESAPQKSTDGSGDGITDLKIPRKFVRVPGFDGRFNDIVYCKPLEEDEGISVDSDSSPTGAEEGRQRLIVYFGGDMQDFPEIMEQHKEHRSYVCWNLEATAQLLQKQFPTHHIVVVRPSRIQIMTFSCYDNFCNCNHTGVPDHVITHGSLHHLEALLKNLSDRIEKSQKQDLILLAKQIDDVGKDEGAQESEVSSTTPEVTAMNGVSSNSKDLSESTNEAKIVNPHLDRAKISLVGFSKGCVVLNQLLYEFHYLKTLTPDDSSMDNFVSCIEDMYWLDGGHNGGKNTWITSRSLLETLTRLGVTVHVHMTPYQLNDDRRPWIRKEERQFSDWLKRFNAPLKRYVHFETEAASLQQHFRLIAEFGTAEKTMEPEGSSEESQNEPSHTGILSM